jgi:hypothetical protein
MWEISRGRSYEFRHVPKLNIFSLVPSVTWCGVGLSQPGKSATVWPIVPAPDNFKWWCGWKSRWNDWQGKPKYSQKTYLMPLCPTQIPNVLTWVWIHPTAVGTHWLTAWTTTWPTDRFSLTLHGTVHTKKLFASSYCASQFMRVFFRVKWHVFHLYSLHMFVTRPVGM